ncbi:hypothetical protein Aperf_G00000074049 [Anoplocephala perfoliata]
MMLDADSVFDRLLKEATNLIPKMSTPKLSAALNVSSALHQRINDTLASRLSQEQTVVSTIPTKNFCVQGVQSIVGAPVISEEFVSENTFLTTADPNFAGRAVASANYAAIPFFPQLNQFAVGQRAATIVTISGPNGGTTTGAVVGTLGPPTAVSGQSAGQPLIVPLQPAPPLPPQHQSSDSSILQQQQQQQTQSGTTSVSGKGDSVCDQTCAALITTANGPHAAATANGHIITATGLECAEMKPDPTSCLPRVGEDQQASATLYAVSQSNVSSSAITFLPADAATTTTSPSASITSTVPVTPSNTVVMGHPLASTPVASGAATITTTGAKVTHGGVMSSVGATSSNGSGGGPYRCQNCGKEFRVLRYLEKHKRIHTGEKPYQCCFCGRLFNDWPNMNRHKRIHTGERPYRCSVCSKTFSQPAVYNEHVKRHTGERPYVCTVCSKGFPRAARLSVHMRVHTGEKPYRCDVCDRRFSQPHHVSTHVRIHSGDRSFRSGLRDGISGVSANSKRNRKQDGGKSTSTESAAKAKSEASANTDASSPNVQGTQAGVRLGSNGGVGVQGEDGSVDPESLKPQEGEIQASNSSPMENSCDVGLTNSTALSASTATLASPATADVSAVASIPAVPTTDSLVQSVGLTTSENFCVQSHPTPIFDANGTIYISTMDGTATISGNGVSTAPGSATTTITSTLPQIQIHHHANLTSTTAAAFSGDPHHHLQPQGGPIQICYSSNPTHTTSDPTTIIMSPGAAGKPQLFSPMLVPIGTAATSSFAYPAAVANPSAAFQTLPSQQQQAVTMAGDMMANPPLSSPSSSSIVADV